MDKILVTGAAGFIGYNLCKALITRNISIICLDNLNAYYDINLKENRLKNLKNIAKNSNLNLEFIRGSLEDKALLEDIFKKQNPNIVINLAAQAGVRYSLKNPINYINSNILGFTNLLECCRYYPIKNLIYASSSSVYGGNTKIPFNESDPVNHPVSLYAATKISNELFAHAYSHLFSIPATGLRFFTVYGPWGRPDMAPMIFTKSILEKRPIQIFNKGNMKRDFTYIDDVIEIILRVIKKPATPNTRFLKDYPEASSSWAPHRIFNVGNSKTINLMDFINLLEIELGTKAIKEFKNMQDGDVVTTFADTNKIYDWVKYRPNTSLQKGLHEFVKWYKEYYQVTSK